MTIYKANKDCKCGNCSKTIKAGETAILFPRHTEDGQVYISNECLECAK